MKFYVVIAPTGRYEDNMEPIDKIFSDKEKAIQYVEEENAKLPLKQAEICKQCPFRRTNPKQSGNIRPKCFRGGEYDVCLDSWKNINIHKLFMEEYEDEVDK